MTSNCNLKIVERIMSECSASISLSQNSAKRFFKTAEGSYSASDAFLGITVPTLRKITKTYKHVGLDVVEELLKSQYNEVRLLALLIMVDKYNKGDKDCKKAIYSFYMQNMRHVNNWNLVDSSAHHILGHYLWDKDRSLLNKLAVSKILWERRVSIVATWYFIRRGDVTTTFEISKILLHDTHDLIHKATGWMLREAGKKDESGLVSFLSIHASHMPKTMLRYARERLSSLVLLSN